MVKKKPTAALPTGKVFLDSELPRADADYAQYGLRYGMGKQKPTLEKIREAMGAKPPKTRKGTIPSVSVQIPPPSKSRGKAIEGRVVRGKLR